MPTINDLWSGADVSLQNVEVTADAWRLINYLSNELVWWYGWAAREVSGTRGEDSFRINDLTVVMGITEFPLDPDDLGVNAFHDSEGIDRILRGRRPGDDRVVAEERVTIENDVIELLRRISGRTVDLVLLEAHTEAEHDGRRNLFPQLIATRHVIHICDRLPYPLDSFC